MKKNIFYIIILLLSTVWLGCDKELDITPTDEVDGAKAFATLEGVEKGVLDVYGSMSAFSHIAINDRASDDLRLSDQNTGQGVQIHTWAYSADQDDFEVLWQDPYNTIDRANRMFEWIAPFAENGEEQDLVQQLQGELYFLRAFNHFQLAKSFCGAYNASALGLPYMEVSEAGQPARISQADYFAKINADLVAAKGLIPAIFPQTYFGDSYRANLTAVSALQAAVALHMEEWQNAETYATEAIDGAFSLATLAEYANVWDDSGAEGVESIFVLARVVGDETIGGIYNRTTNDDVFFAPSNELMGLYDVNDIRGGLFFAPEGGDFIVNKHFGPAGQKNLVDIKYLRVSEMYLIRAEAHARQNELTEATADINILLTERIVGHIGYPDFADETAAMNEIMLQRRLELAYEGFRFYDLKRWGLPVDRLDEDIVLANESKTLEAGNYRFVFPIPQEEIFANSNMEQNPGY